MFTKQGVYKIINKINGKVYYGSASNSFKERWIDHQYKLNKQTHGNKHLQAAWNKYGANNFEFIIVLLCAPDNCLFYEQLFLDRCWDNGIRCYNAARIAGNPMKDRKHSIEAKKKMSTIQKELKCGAKNPAYGKQRSSSTRNRQSQTIRETLKQRADKLKSGYTGVYWQKSRNKWAANITIKSKTIHLGRFNSLEDAISARKKAENLL